MQDDGVQDGESPQDFDVVILAGQRLLPDHGRKSKYMYGADASTGSPVSW
jgi:hypothetical protein